MIDAKQAVQIAMARAEEMLGPATFNLEEVEKEEFEEREVWGVTLSFPKEPDALAQAAHAGTDPLQYKRFLIDLENGEMLAMRIR